MSAVINKEEEKDSTSFVLFLFADQWKLFLELS